MRHARVHPHAHAQLRSQDAGASAVPAQWAAGLMGGSPYTLEGDLIEIMNRFSC